MTSTNPPTAAEFRVLVALADGEKHGYTIGKEIEARTDGQVQLRAATLYTVIKRLLDNGYIDENTPRPIPTWTTRGAGPPVSRPAGERRLKPKRCDSKTRAGRRARNYGGQRREPWVGKTGCSER